MHGCTDIFSVFFFFKFGRVVFEPLRVNRIDLKLLFQVNVTADHRIIYGADLAAFLQTFSKIIENPESLTL